jgi:staphylococcal nuclease domain-containing protein 1
VRALVLLRSPLTARRNIAEQLIEKGLASVIRHKRDDEDRSAEFDKLMVAEQA